MRALILAGGKGTRLRPYTISFPKPLMPIGDYPILEIIVRQLARQGFGRVTVSTGHLAELIEAYFGDGARWGVSIDYLREDVPLSTAGVLGLIEMDADELLVMNGDVLTTVDYAALVREQREHGAMATVAVKERTTTIDFGVVESGADDVLTGWIEKPEYRFSVSMGVYVVSRAACELVRSGEAIGMPDLLLRVKDSGGKVHIHRSDAYWLDIGRVDDYERAQEEFEKRRVTFVGEDA